MYFKYGTYQHPDGEVAFRGMQIRKIRGPRNAPLVLQKVLRCRIEVIADGQANIYSRLQEISNAYSFEGIATTAGFYHDDGTRSGIFIDGTLSETGLQVQDFPAPSPVDGADYATHLALDFSLSADFVPIDAAELVDYAESLSFVGSGGPRKAWQITDTGQPIQWTLAQFTTQRIVQAGFAVGRTGYPTPNSPIFSASLMNQESSSTDYGSPDANGSVFRNFRVGWKYEFETGTPLIGLPIAR